MAESDNILTKLHDLLVYLIPQLNKFPRDQKFVLGDRIETKLLDVQEDCLRASYGRFAPLPIAASRTGLLGGTVATVGFPDIGLQGFKNPNDEGRMKNEETGQQQVHADWHNSSFILLHSSFPLVVAGECELRGQEQPALELPGIRAGCGRQAQSAQVFADGHPEV